MPLTIPVAHDFNCPWCWIGLFQARRLREEFGVEIEWRGYELCPEGMALPEPAEAGAPGRTTIPSRLELAYAAGGLEPPEGISDYAYRTHNAHEAVEFAKTIGVQDELVDRIYRAYWKHGLDVNDLGVLRLLLVGLSPDPDEMLAAIQERRFADRIVPFDAAAYQSGVFYVPTFWIGGERYAEQPYSVLRKAMVEIPTPQSEIRNPKSDIEAPYASLDFPPAPEGRPYTFCNMVATIDGKILSGERNEGVMDLGSETDHVVLRRIENAADAVMIGAETLRATKGIWFPKKLFRIVVTRSGGFSFESRFFTDAPDRAIVACPKGVVQGQDSAQGCRLEGGATLPDGIRVFEEGEDGVDFPALAKRLRTELGIERLLVEGGSELNASMIAAGLIDELFLTLAPKVKLGRNVPTYAGGEPLPREAIQDFHIVEERQVGDELFLRYRRNP